MTRLVAFAAALALAALISPGLSASSHGKDFVQATNVDERTTKTKRINAQSGPNGENPTGTIMIASKETRQTFAVTCLEIDGGRAVVGGEDSAGKAAVAFVEAGANPSLPGHVLVEPATAPVDCSACFKTTVDLASVFIHDS